MRKTFGAMKAGLVGCAMLPAGLSLISCVGVGAFVTDNHETTRRVPREQCLSGPLYEDFVQDSKLVRQKDVPNGEVHVYRTGVSFRGVVVGVIIPIPLVMPFPDKKIVTWEARQCTYSERRRDLRGWFIPYKFG